MKTSLGARLQHVSTPYPAGRADALRDFYGGVLGLVEKEVPASLAGGGLVWYEAGDGELELHFIAEEDWSPPRLQRHFCLELSDLGAARERVERAGRFLREATPIPNRPRFFCTDPFGNLVELTTILGDYLTTEP